MIVVADASPLNYLIQIESANILHALFGRVLVPVAVMQELRYSRAPSQVKSWLSQIPSWVEVRTIAATQDEALQILDPGEREAILLAQETHADLLLIDEKQGRLEAKRRGITTTGQCSVRVQQKSLLQKADHTTKFDMEADGKIGRTLDSRIPLTGYS